MLLYDPPAGSPPGGGWGRGLCAVASGGVLPGARFPRPAVRRVPLCVQHQRRGPTRTPTCPFRLQKLSQDQSAKHRMHAPGCCCCGPTAGAWTWAQPGHASLGAHNGDARMRGQWDRMGWNAHRRGMMVSMPRSHRRCALQLGHGCMGPPVELWDWLWDKRHQETALRGEGASSLVASYHERHRETQR